MAMVFGRIHEVVGGVGGLSQSVTSLVLFGACAASVCLHGISVNSSMEVLGRRSTVLFSKPTSPLLAPTTFFLSTDRARGRVNSSLTLPTARSPCHVFCSATKFGFPATPLFATAEHCSPTRLTAPAPLRQSCEHIALVRPAAKSLGKTRTRMTDSMLALLMACDLQPYNWKSLMPPLAAATRSNCWPQPSPFGTRLALFFLAAHALTSSAPDDAPNLPNTLRPCP
ncbi:uncharacterized protein IWZ02DRAFT_42290 [Phyllosticta citriasiana]|uniref:uncharacterized protein n=1 Tax=Phyllosticta citriasiana TaxID=595635 RepID=UPI0030FD48A9